MDDINVVLSISEFVKDRLYFITFGNMLELSQTSPYVHYFCTDNIFKYENFFSDFGPLNLSMLYRYCNMLNTKLRNIRAKRIIHATSSSVQKRVNAAYLIGSYAIIYLDFTPQQAYETLTVNSKERFIEFRDASSADPHTMSLLDCLTGLYKAKSMGFFDFENFDAEHYEFYERVENGDLNWIVPRKFLAFCGPHNSCRNMANYPIHGVAFYHRYFRTNGVTTIVRLNKRAYNASLFTRVGFAHRDLYFLDGSTPTDDILYEFLQICENTTGAIAVHCKAGLGRTGTLIACYIMKHYRFTAREAIAWIRICRPGSIIGPQQEWLLSKMTEMWHDGQMYRRRRWRAPRGPPSPPKHKMPIYPLRAGQPFAGLASKHHRQHIRLHCRNTNHIIESIVSGINGRLTPIPSAEGSTINDNNTISTPVNTRLRIKQQRDQANLAGNKPNTAGNKNNVYKVIQRKVNTLKLEDKKDDVFADEDDVDPLKSEDECDRDSENNSEEGDDEDDEVESIPVASIPCNNNNNHCVDTKRTIEPETAEEDDTDTEQEIAEVNANIPKELVKHKKVAANANSNTTKVSNSTKSLKVGGFTQGDKLNQIKAQRMRYTRPAQPPLDLLSTSMSNSVPSAKVSVKSSNLKSTQIGKPHIVIVRLPSEAAKGAAPRPAHNDSSRYTYSKRRGCSGLYNTISTTSAKGKGPLSSSNTNLHNTRRTSPRLAAQAAAAAVIAPNTEKTCSGTSTTSSSEGSEEETASILPIRPNANIWVSRVVPNTATTPASTSNMATLSGVCDVGRDTRAKRALISERRIVKVFRKSNQGPNGEQFGAGNISGAPTKSRKVDESSNKH